MNESCPQVKADWAEPELVLAVKEYTPKVIYVIDALLLIQVSPEMSRWQNPITRPMSNSHYFICRYFLLFTYFCVCLHFP